jgi:hypothetical protein
MRGLRVPNASLRDATSWETDIELTKETRGRPEHHILYLKREEEKIS